MLVRILPDVAGKISEPLSKTEKIVIINSGNGSGGGASKLTGDVTQIISQLPPVIESLTDRVREVAGTSVALKQAAARRMGWELAEASERKPPP